MEVISNQIRFVMPADLGSIINEVNYKNQQSSDNHHIENICSNWDEGSCVIKKIASENWLLTLIKVNCTKPFSICPVQTRGMVALCYGLKGQMVCHICEQEQWLLKESSYGLYYVPPGYVQKLEFASGVHELLCISFSRSFLSRIKDIHRDFDLFFEHMLSQNKKGSLRQFTFKNRIERLLHEIEMSVGPAQKLVLQARISDLVVEYFNDIQSFEKGARFRDSESYKEAITKAVSYICENYFRVKPIPKIARDVGMNSQTFRRRFKEVTNMTPLEFVNSCQATNARDMLIATSKSVDDIALTVGLSDRSHLVKLFRKYFNCTPNEFRQQVKLCT